MKKRGELTTQQIVILVIAILSFVVILFLLVRLNLGETSDKQICHNSVVLKSKQKLGGGNLDCKTTYVCISGGDKCANSAMKVEVDPNNKEEIMDAIASEMADCWWMFGEGTIKYAGVSDSVTCARCSSINFDEKILEKEYKISYREFYEYLNKLNKTNAQTYFNYLYDSSDIEGFQSNSNLKIDLDNDFILDSSEYVVVTGFRDWFGLLYIHPYYVKSNELNKLEPKCNNFIEKA